MPGEKAESREGIQQKVVETSSKALVENRGGTLRKAGPSGDSLAMQNISERYRKTNRVLAFISEQKADHSSFEQL